MKSRWIGLIVAAIFLVSILLLNDRLLSLRNTTFESPDFKQYIACRENFCNNLNYPSDYAVDDQVKGVYCETYCNSNPEVLKQSCGILHGETLEKIYNFVHGIWRFIFQSSTIFLIPFWILAPFIMPLLILLAGYGIGYFIERKLGR